MGVDSFIPVTVGLSIILLIWNCVEVGRNDAANLVNAVFGSRVMKRKRAVILAGIFVVLGATFSSPVMDTVRKGIYDLGGVTAAQAVSVFVSAYIVGTVLLYVYSAFGMPVSTTATLVFCLAGGAIGASQSLSIVNWPTLTKVVAAIILSVVLSGIAGFLVQRVFRGAIRDKADDLVVLLIHGPWVTGLIMTFLSWFMVVKGLKGIAWVKVFKTEFLDVYGTVPLLLGYWAVLTLITHIVLVSINKKYVKYLFHVTSIFGMCCMAFAFGQNDLANAASPGIATFFIYKAGVTTGSVDIPRWILFMCGFLIFLGMMSKKAQRVTRAEVNMGSQYDSVAIYAPGWCKALARLFIRKQKNEEDMTLAPAPHRNESNKKVHYDTLRASVIMAVSASVIAFASGLGLPVSTTYVAFAAVLATGWGDNVFSFGDADKKVGRAIWVIFSWFTAALIAAVATSFVAFMVSKLYLVGVAIMMALNLAVKFYFERRSNRHEEIHHIKAK